MGTVVGGSRSVHTRHPARMYEGQGWMAEGLGWAGLRSHQLAANHRSTSSLTFELTAFAAPSATLKYSDGEFEFGHILASDASQACRVCRQSLSCSLSGPQLANPPVLWRSPEYLVAHRSRLESSCAFPYCFVTSKQHCCKRHRPQRN